uniref:Uncharacterized protein n=1 Tax=Meloidogyne enterolobii TaxID=390850 RepID=A0A6V7UZF0_MELEN|nr:unnamed protein product [Meloidogyne enterolobii]
MLWKNCGWEMELNHHGMSPDRSTTDCATIQPIAGLFIFIYVLSASADTTNIKLNLVICNSRDVRES